MGRRLWAAAMVFTKGKCRSATLVGPFVAYYGAFTVDDANNTVTYKIEHAGSPLQNGTTRVQKVIFDSDTLTWTGSELRLPRGVITPINVWKKAE
jgi:hypothetical protein